MTDEKKVVTQREMDIVMGNTKERLDSLSSEVKKVHDCLDGARREIGELKQENATQTADIQHLKENADRADESRKRMHDKLDKIVNAPVKPSTIKPAVGRNQWDIALELIKNPALILYVAFAALLAKELGVWGWLLSLFGG